MTAITHLSPAGDVAIPADVLAAHGWHAGTRFEIVSQADGILLRAAAASTSPRLTLTELLSRLPPPPATPASLAEIEAAVTDEREARATRTAT